jgi:predicted permease
MGTLLHDLRYGMRMIKTKPGFAAAAVLVLGLGIGANSAVFSLVNAFLLKPTMLHQPEQLMGCFSRDVHKPDSYRGFSYPNYADLRDRNPVFTSLMAHNMAMVGISEGETTRRAFADLVSSNYFSTLGVPLFRGRAFSSDEERPGSNVAVAIASYSFWKRSGLDPDLVGKTVRINSRIFTVVGIAPEGFTGTTAMVSSEFYLPLGMYEAVINDFDGRARPLADRSNHQLILVGRMRQGMNQKTADAQLATVAFQMAAAYPAENKDQTLIVHTLSRLSVSDGPVNDNIAAPVILFLSMAAVVLLIASLNVANMMLARGTARRKEIAVRLALGAARANILRQLFTEGLILALLGGVAGLLIAYWSTGLLVHSLARVAPIDLIYNAGPDLRVLAATMTFCVLSTLLFSLGPALSLSRPDVITDIKGGVNQDTAPGKRLFSRRNILVMSQISLSLALLTAGGLFLRSAQKAAGLQPGFRVDGGVVVEVDASLAGYDEAHGRQIYPALVDRLRSIPGVESASLAATAPFGMIHLGRGVQRASDPAPSASTPKGSVQSFGSNIVGKDYFQTLGIPVLRGRSFTASETGNGAKLSVAILDKTAAERLWPKGDAVGQRIRVIADNAVGPAPELEVIGVVGTVQDSVYGKRENPYVYLPFGAVYQADMNIHLKTSVAGVDAEGKLLEAVRNEIRNTESRLPVLSLKTLRGHLDSSFDLWSVRICARMFSLFGGVALLLAMIGLYGVRAYTVARRTREIGIRMALGAQTGDTLRMVLREGLLVTSIGLAIGLALSAGLGKVLSSFLYEVSAIDPVVFSTAPILLAAISLLACYVPARRAARVDPMVALRYE